MATRKELGAKYMDAGNRLCDEIYARHSSYTGSTYIGSATADLVEQCCKEFEQRLTEMRKLSEAYLVLAPEMRSQHNNEISDIQEAINSLRNSVRRVQHQSEKNDSNLVTRLSALPGFDTSRIYATHDKRGTLTDYGYSQVRRATEAARKKRHGGGW